MIRKGQLTLKVTGFLALTIVLAIGLPTLIVTANTITNEFPEDQVEIDIKPGSASNSFNCTNEHGILAVAILTTDDFDATTVDHTTVTFEGASETHLNKKTGEPRRHEQDVDKDRDIDLVFHFRLGDTDLTCGSTEGTLIGETFGGQHIRGTDALRPIPPYYYTTLVKDPSISHIVATITLLGFGLFAGLALVFGSPVELKRHR